MGRMEYLAMKTDPATSELINSDLKELGNAAKKLATHAMMLGSIAFATSFLRLLSNLAALYLLILDRTNWRTKMLTSLLIPYNYLTAPAEIFDLFSGNVGKWIAFVTVVLRLFFPKHFPEFLEMPGTMILLLAVAPNFFAHTLRDSWVGLLICLLIGAYLLQEHIRATGGFKNSFTQSNGILNTLGIIILKVYPIWALVVHFLHLQ